MENQKSISEWAISTFGEPENGFVLMEKLKEELYELAARINIYVNDPLRVNFRGVADEIADIVIMAYQICNRYGLDLHEVIDQKMAVNRKRKWDIIEPGIGKHKEE